MIKPLLDRVLLQKVEEETVTKSGIILTDKPKEVPSQGKVIAIGPGKIEDGNLIEMTVQEGDVVIYKQYAGTSIEYQGEDYVIIDIKDVLAVVKEEN